MKKKAKAKYKTKVIGETYLHLCNSGAYIRVLDTQFGPALEVEALAFGHTFGHTRIFTDRISLRKISSMLLEAADSHVFQPEYCHPAKALWRKKGHLVGETEECEEECDKDSPHPRRR